MFCSSCHNLLKKVTDANSLKFQCEKCGEEYPAKDIDTLLYTEDKKIYNLYKDGKSIFHYPSNQKIFKDCKSCNAKMVAFERDSELNKIYGCACGYTWKEFISN